MSWKNDLYFTKRERRGVAVLLIITFIVTMLPSVVAKFQPPKQSEDYAARIEQIKAQSVPVEEPNYNKANRQNKNLSNSNAQQLENAYNTNVSSPNLINPKKPKVNQKVIKDQKENIINTNKNNEQYVGTFTGIKDTIQERPNSNSDNYENNFKQQNLTQQNPVQKKQPTSKAYKQFEKTYKNSNVVIEINAANAKDFTQLKGIGDKLSIRIITFRTKLGGFTTVNQVGETFGIEPETFQSFKHQLTVNTNNVTKLNLNTATQEQLSDHPYISPKLASQIINFREKVKPFESYEDVQKLYYFQNQPELYKKLKPYISF